MKQNLDNFIITNKNSINYNPIDEKLSDNFENNFMLKLTEEKKTKITINNSNLSGKDYTKLIFTSVFTFLVFTLVLIFYFIQQAIPQNPLTYLEFYKSYNFDFSVYFKNKIMLFIVITFSIYMFIDIKFANKKQKIV